MKLLNSNSLIPTKYLIIFLVMVFAVFCKPSKVYSQGQGSRPDIQSFSTADQEELRDLILFHTEFNLMTIIHNDRIIADGMENDANLRVHNQGKRFLPWHRDIMIGLLENFLIDTGFPQFVPLPKWNPNTDIPDAFFVDAHVVIAGCQGIECDPPQNQFPGPFDFSEFDISSNMDICNGPYFEDGGLGFSNRLESAHNPVHGAVGGSFGTGYSPSSAIFYLWHAWLDDIFEAYLCRCSDDDDGFDDLYNNFDVIVDEPNITFLQNLNIPGVNAFHNLSTTGSVVILDGKEMLFFSGNKIILNPGFETELGADFEARVDKCIRPGDQTFGKKGTDIGDEPTVIENTEKPIIKTDAIEKLFIAGIHPNPTSGEFTITLSPSPLLSQINIYDIFGRLIEQLTMSNGQLTIDISQHNKGIYFVKVIQVYPAGRNDRIGGEQIFIKKLIHQ